jgi:2-oxoglutarate dehydrogenase E2 component (dihydrolipoamide succinyltransferase)
MATNIVVPALGESVVEATVANWLKQEGDRVESGEAVVELETDKVDLEVPAETSGILAKIERQTGDDVEIGDVLGVIQEAEGAAGPGAADEGAQPEPETAPPEPAREPAAPSPSTPAAPAAAPEITPVARRMADEQGVDLGQVTGSGPGGRITRQDVEEYVRQREDGTAVEERRDGRAAPAQAEAAAPAAQPAPAADARGEERVRMSRRRRTIAERLVQAQQTAAMLTTFNEIDMSAVVDMRKRRREQFIDQHGVSLGFTSFFVKAIVGALKEFPQLNAEIDGTEIVLKHYYDIGIAVGAEEGLVVPVLRDADRMSFAAIEQEVKGFVEKSRDGTLSIEDLRGGTFTITNGGVFGSLLSTPILNPPQVGILGLHKIEERPVVVQGDDGAKEIAIRPMMYVALSYDHRIVDGREAVQFLVKVKELIEDPEELLLAG